MDMSFWKDKNVVVTGGGGFLGSHVVSLLKGKSPRHICVPRRAQYDLRSKDAIESLLHREKPDMVIHLAAEVGGIEKNRLMPAKIFYDNLIMGIQMMDLSYRAGVKKFVVIGTICSYPKFTPVPFREEDLWSGYPEETNAPYGLAKKMLLVQSQAYRQEYGFNSIVLLPVNLYGPGDNFDPVSSHIIPAAIRKCAKGAREGKKEIEMWGTGEVSREFVYVEDVARAILLASELYDGADPVNIGTGREIKVKDLVKLISTLTGYSGDFVWNHARPSGQPRRCLDVTKAKKLFGFEAKMTLEEGLRKTVSWYKSISNNKTPKSGL